MITRDTFRSNSVLIYLTECEFVTIKKRQCHHWSVINIVQSEHLGHLFTHCLTVWSLYLSHPLSVVDRIGS